MFCLKQLSLTLLSCALLAPSWAGSAMGSFNVNINLITNTETTNNPNNRCVQQALSQGTGAVVSVVCSTGQFVSIEPQPGRPFLGTHGGAFRFVLGPTSPMPIAMGQANNWLNGTGTVTGMRVLQYNGEADLLEMLVSF